VPDPRHDDAPDHSTPDGSVGGTLLPPVVDVAWLRSHRDDVVVADVRSYLDGRSGRAAHEAGHLPGAVFVDLDHVLAAPAGPGDGRHPMPSATAFATGLGRVGIGDDDTVVAYDDTGGMTAGRLVWMLRLIGRPAALLDGGVVAWNGALESGAVVRAPVDRTPVDWPVHRTLSTDDVANLATSEPATVLVDARGAERYRGDAEPIDRVAGHVPGARNVPWASLLGLDGRFRSPAELRQRFADVGITDGTPVVAMCGSGVSACVDLIALELAGLGPARLYPGSWSAWSSDPDRPVATGDEP
jgi:thiosulfate/3-mercaptopyruvate sulfurtransferase